jgi:hypothetical protein
VALLAAEHRRDHGLEESNGMMANEGIRIGLARGRQDHRRAVANPIP